ncbi:hypothetical protein TRVL_06043 [Trypanosoma vivax]|nr:hypothetical protein TRVL_06043 [Trypanosoma vivax]
MCLVRTWWPSVCVKTAWYSLFTSDPFTSAANRSGSVRRLHVVFVPKLVADCHLTKVELNAHVKGVTFTSLRPPVTVLIMLGASEILVRLYLKLSWPLCSYKTSGKRPNVHLFCFSMGVSCC